MKTILILILAASAALAQLPQPGGGGGGGSSSGGGPKEQLAAICQGGAAASGFSMVSTANAYPTPNCPTLSNAVYGVLQFRDSYTQSIQTRMAITGTTISLDIWWRSSVADNTKNVVWQVQTACVATGESGDPSWNTAQTVTSAAAGTTNLWTKATISSITTTGCAAGEAMLVKLYRDPTHASDTIAATAELISLVWSIS